MGMLLTFSTGKICCLSHCAGPGKVLCFTFVTVGYKESFIHLFVQRVAG